VNEPCRCKLIEELGTITIGDVKTWLRDIYEYEFLRIEKIREIFKERKQKNMAEIEIELKKIIEEYVKENS